VSALSCSACGHENRAGRRFCSGCGAPLAVACPTCAAPIEPGDRFCGACGTALHGEPIAAAPHRTRDPHVYTPRHLAEKILSSRAALEGERKQVTVLFAEVKGSMELAESLDPEEVKWFDSPRLGVLW